jgi:hypothetical protein
LRFALRSYHFLYFNLLFILRVSFIYVLNRFYFVITWDVFELWYFFQRKNKEFQRWNTPDRKQAEKSKIFDNCARLTSFWLLKMPEDEV